MQQKPKRRSKRFNSRLREEATAQPVSSPPPPGVSTHASVRRRPAEERDGAGGGRGFNSRLREEATAESDEGSGGDGVSTHASVRRRRPINVVRFCSAPVSTHASVRRRLSSPIQSRPSKKSFNSRLREEATHPDNRCAKQDDVSTHASVRRRQYTCDHGINAKRVSTHASVRRRRGTGGFGSSVKEFQLTPP